MSRSSQLSRESSSSTSRFSRAIRRDGGAPERSRASRSAIRRGEVNRSRSSRESSLASSERSRAASLAWPITRKTRWRNCQPNAALIARREIRMALRTAHGSGGVKDWGGV